MIREIIHINSFSTFIIGIILNTLLVVLVLNKSTPEMKVFSHILLQTALTDLFMLIINLVTQPIFTFDGDANIVVLNSPFNSNLIPKDILLAIWDNCLLFSIFSQAAQFIYRYLCLNRFFNRYRIIERSPIGIRSRSEFRFPTSDFRVPTFEPFPIFDSSDFHHLHHFRSTPDWHRLTPY
uniref:Uncharacterized protein n=1 Tax=Meloidogyne enterolobii TaxID=390850 RepID=A0A6V7Y070_MELEN|nr:unnamed protein product [Meloidogyne enterolobii]